MTDSQLRIIYREEGDVRAEEGHGLLQRGVETLESACHELTSESEQTRLPHLAD